MNDDIGFLKRLPTRIPGLDKILGGGLFVGGIYLVTGKPGAGKTLLANQLAYSHVAEGGRALYVTLLTESHAWLISTLQGMIFFREEVVSSALQYISGYQALEKERLDGLLRLLRKVVRDHKATLLVIDGLVTAGAMAESPLEVKKFIHELQNLVQLVSCTTILLTGSTNDETSYAERTMVDGLVQLSTRRVGMRMIREIDIEKHRGSGHFMGPSFFEISSAGIRIYPRIEATIGVDLGAEAESQGLLSTGLKALDAMLDGGLPARSTTMVVGSPGSGKTLLGLHFLSAGADRGEPGLYFGFFESPARVLAKARSIGIDLRSHVDRGLVEIQCFALQEQLADRLADELLRTLQERKIKRLFIDGLMGFKSAVVYPERVGAFITSLTNELRRLGVTTLVAETTGLFDPEVEMPVGGVAAVVESIISFRSIQQSLQQRRLISVKKMREGRYDSSLRELSITDGGLEVAAAPTSIDELLNGSEGAPEAARETPAKRKPRSTRRRGE
jgi:circadian clock protein KaiC